MKYMLRLQGLSKNRYLSLKHLSTRSANRLPPLDARLKIEYVVDIVPEFIIQTLEILQGKLVKLA